MISSLFQVLAALLSVYMLIIFMRILLSWFQPRGAGRFVEILHKITDPWLSIFRRIQFLKVGRFDFSPIAAILVLVVAENVFLKIAETGTITGGTVLALLVGAVWSAVSFLAFFYIVLIIIRLLGLILAPNGASPIWQALDTIVQPLVFRITRLFKIQKPMKYSTMLTVIAILLIVITLVIRFLIKLLIAYLMFLPF